MRGGRALSARPSPYLGVELLLHRREPALVDHLDDLGRRFLRGTGGRVERPDPFDDAPTAISLADRQRRAVVRDGQRTVDDLVGVGALTLIEQPLGDLVRTHREAAALAVLELL